MEIKMGKSQIFFLDFQKDNQTDYAFVTRKKTIMKICNLFSGVQLCIRLSQSPESFPFLFLHFLILYCLSDTHICDIQYSGLWRIGFNTTANFVIDVI